MSEKKFKSIKVLVERIYVVPIARSEYTEINGWTMEEVAEDWFKQFSINKYHATRDSHHLGNGDRIVSVEIQDVEESADKLGQAAAHPVTYSSTQATNCAVCGKHKHTPLRVDKMGGYVCLTCIDAALHKG